MKPPREVVAVALSFDSREPAQRDGDPLAVLDLRAQAQALLEVAACIIESPKPKQHRRQVAGHHRQPKLVCALGEHGAAPLLQLLGFLKIPFVLGGDGEVIQIPPLPVAMQTQLLGLESAPLDEPLVAFECA